MRGGDSPGRRPGYLRKLLENFQAREGGFGAGIFRGWGKAGRQERMWDERSTAGCPMGHSNHRPAQRAGSGATLRLFWYSWQVCHADVAPAVVLVGGLGTG